MKLVKHNTENEELDDVIIKLRWGKQTRDNIQFSCYSYRVISKIVNRSITYCRRVALEYKNDEDVQHKDELILSRIKRRKALDKKLKKTYLDKIHLDYIKSEEVLKSQVGMTI